MNVYAFSPDEQLISCCSCLITPNGLVSCSTQNDLISNTLTGTRPNSVVVKLLATATGGTAAAPSYTGSSCSNSAAGAGGVVPIERWWYGRVGDYSALGDCSDGNGSHGSSSVLGRLDRTFTPSTLSAGQLASITNRCTNIIGNGSTFGICRSCRFGGLGAGSSSR